VDGDLVAELKCLVTRGFRTMRNNPADQTMENYKVQRDLKVDIRSALFDRCLFTIGHRLYDSPSPAGFGCLHSNVRVVKLLTGDDRDFMFPAPRPHLEGNVGPAQNAGDLRIRGV
jgi:hypothetical protein